MPSLHGHHGSSSRIRRHVRLRGCAFQHTSLRTTAKYIEHERRRAAQSRCSHLSRLGRRDRGNIKASFLWNDPVYHSLTIPLGARALHGVAFPIKSSRDVIRVPIDTYIFPTLSKAKMTSFPITPLRSEIRL